MSFLARLIERHLGDAPAPFPLLEPRLPSRFEPAAPAAAPQAPGWDVEAPHAPAAGISGPPPAAPVAPESRARRETSEGAARRAGATPAALGTVSATVQAAASRVAPADRARALSPVIEGPAAAPVRPSTAPDGPGPAPPSGTPDERSPARSPTAARPSLRPAVPSSRAIRAERDRPEPRGGRTIHVTIGRVDVRAVTAPAATPPRPNAPVETSSLEDYLRGRAGGRR
jgi:hypothetical protein